MPALDGDKIQTLEKRTTISYLANSGLNSISVICHGKQKKKEISTGAGVFINQTQAILKTKLNKLQA